LSEPKHVKHYRQKTLYNMPLETDSKAATGDALGEDIYDVELFKKG
jgi:hypothetical protein